MIQRETEKSQRFRPAPTQAGDLTETEISIEKMRAAHENLVIQSAGFVEKRLITKDLRLIEIEPDIVRMGGYSLFAARHCRRKIAARTSDIRARLECEEVVRLKMEKPLDDFPGLFRAPPFQGVFCSCFKLPNRVGRRRDDARVSSRGFGSRWLYRVMAFGI